MSELPPVNAVRSRGARDIVSVGIEISETLAVGAVSIDRAKNGDKVPPLKGASVTSLFGVSEMIRKQDEAISVAEQLHEDSVEILARHTHRT